MKDKIIEWIPLDIFGEDEEFEEIDEEFGEPDYLEQEKADFAHPLMGGMDLSKMGKVVNTPMGMMMLDDSWHPLRGLPILMAHVNFPITNGLFDRIDKIEGIEAFKLIGRYRLVFVFGRLFDLSEVIFNIEDIMGIDHISDSIDLDELPEEAKSVIYKIDAEIESESWVAYIYPNCKYTLSNCKDSEEALAVYEEYKELYDVSEGLLLSSVEPQ